MSAYHNYTFPLNGLQFQYYNQYFKKEVGNEIIQNVVVIDMQ